MDKQSVLHRVYLLGLAVDITDEELEILKSKEEVHIKQVSDKEEPVKHGMSIFISNAGVVAICTGYPYHFYKKSTKEAKTVLNLLKNIK